MKIKFCCPNCFWDTEIRNYIITNSGRIGNCDFCQSTNTEIIDPFELNDSFQPIVSVYQRCINIEALPDEPLHLHQKIAVDWPNLFRIQDTNHIKSLLASILHEYEECDIFNEIVELKYSADDNQEAYWDKFVNEIKYNNRFFIANAVNLDLLKTLFVGLKKPYRRGKIFYRARISSNTGFSVDQMGKPPYDKSTAGRANPKGISCLYVSSDLTTTLYETRASLYDYLSIGEFRLLENINILNLRDTNKVSPFLLEDSVGEFLRNKKYILRLESELAKPIRRQDSELDYLPTQYLCEFIKSIGFDGVEYKSSLNPDGFNLAIFNDQLFECVKCDVFEVRAIHYDASQI
jgi:hypothetical protein